MKEMAALLLHEVTLWLKSPLWWLGTLVLGFWTLPALAGWQGAFRLPTPPYALGQILEMGLPFAAFFILVAAAAAIQRERGSGLEELLQTLPVSTWRLVLVRWFGGFTAWLLSGALVFTLAAALVVMAYLSQGTPWSDLPSFQPLLFGYFLHYGPPVALFSAVGTLLGILIRAPLPLYVATAALWTASTLGTMVAATAVEPGAEALPPSVHLWHPTGVGGVFRIFPSDLVGFYPYGDRLWAQRFLQLGLAAFSLAMAFLFLGRSRDAGDRRLKGRSRVLWIMAGVSLVFSAAVGTEALWRRPPSVSPLAQTSPALAAVDYDLLVHVHPRRGHYYVEASLTLENQGDLALRSLPLAMDHRCTAISHGDGIATLEEETWGRWTLHIPMPLAPGEKETYRLLYRCDYTLDPYAKLWRQAPPPFLPGIAVPVAPSPAPSRYRLTLDVPEGFAVVSNLQPVGEGIPPGQGWRRYIFAGTTEALEVLAAPWQHDVIEGVHVFYYPQHARQGKELARRLGDRVAFFQTLLGKPGEAHDVLTPFGVVELPDFVRPLELVPVREDLVARLGNDYLDGTVEGYLDRLALALWWGPSVSDRRLSPLQPISPAKEGVLQFLAVLYHDHREGGGLMEEVVTWMEEGWEGPGDDTRGELLQGAGAAVTSSIGNAVFLTLYDVAQRHGEEGLRTVIRAIHAAYAEANGSPSPTDEQLTSEHSLRPVMAALQLLPDGRDLQDRLNRRLQEAGLPPLEGEGDSR